MILSFLKGKAEGREKEKENCSYNNFLFWLFDVETIPRIPDILHSNNDATYNLVFE